MTDNKFLADMLSDGHWHSLDEIIGRSQHERGYGMTVHSRAADLRKQGHDVECRQERTPFGRVRSFYRIVGGALDEVPASDAAIGGIASVSAAGTSSSASSIPAPHDAAVSTQGRSGDVLTSSVPVIDGAEQGSPPPLPVEPAGTLLLFECDVDESAGLRGAYSQDAA